MQVCKNNTKINGKKEQKQQHGSVDKNTCIFVSLITLNDGTQIKRKSLLDYDISMQIITLFFL